MNTFNLTSHGISSRDILRNPSVDDLYALAVENEGAKISSSGSLVAYSGEKTGRSPLDKRIVDEAGLHEDAWWREDSQPFSLSAFQACRNRAIDFLNEQNRVYVIDAYLGWDPSYRLKVRVITSLAYHALFMRNMLIRPTEDELANFGEPDWVIYNAGAHEADDSIEGVTSTTSVSLCFSQREAVILGTKYAGEMKKGLFTVFNYILPKAGVLSMHCSANESEAGDAAIFFGLSGTGKTTLSADPKRKLIGDDEHGWGENGVFNFEGGCYAKVINLSAQDEPQIWQAVNRKGAVLENVSLNDEGVPDFTDTSITENTRGSYPVEFIEGMKIPCVGGHPKHVIFLTCDAFGVLPPVAKLNEEQAKYHFVSGYTAKVAGTEQGIKEPQATFSPCFGGPFLVWPPSKYADLLADKIRKHGSTVWLVNTGWIGGPYGVGKRISIADTRAIIEAILGGSLEGIETVELLPFKLQVPVSCPGIDPALLHPRNTWADKAAYDESAARLQKMFEENYMKYPSRPPLS